MQIGFYSILLILFGYLLGSVPFAYLAGKFYKGKDIRRYGSGTVSGSMVYEHVARWLIVPVGVLDILKAAFPVWLGLQLNLEPWLAIAAGLAASIGHNWPAYLGFTGGRGLGTFLGIWLVVYPWGDVWMLAFLAVGWLLGDSAPFALVSLVVIPIFGYSFGGPAFTLPLSLAMLAITVIKRLEANGRPLPPLNPERRQVLFLRLIYDRDIKEHKEWLAKQPEGDVSDG